MVPGGSRFQFVSRKHKWLNFELSSKKFILGPFWALFPQIRVKHDFSRNLYIPYSLKLTFQVWLISHPSPYPSIELPAELIQPVFSTTKNRKKNCTPSPHLTTTPHTQVSIKLPAELKSKLKCYLTQKLWQCETMWIHRP